VLFKFTCELALWHNEQSALGLLQLMQLLDRNRLIILSFIDDLGGLPWLELRLNLTGLNELREVLNLSSD
jgi:hypothetical protein